MRGEVRRRCTRSDATLAYALRERRRFPETDVQSATRRNLERESRRPGARPQETHGFLGANICRLMRRPRGGIQKHCPRLSCNQCGYAAFPIPVYSKAEKIAEQVIARSNPAEHVIGGCAELRSVERGSGLYCRHVIQRYGGVLRARVIRASTGRRPDISRARIRSAY